MRKLDTTARPLLKLMLYGLPGSTKTRTAATAAWDERTAPALHLDMGGNTLSIGDYPKKPDVLELTRLEELNPVYDYLKGGQKADHQLARKYDLQQYKTVILDTITDVQRDSSSIVMNSQSMGPGDMPPPMQIQHHGSVLRQMMNLTRLFFRLNMNVIFVAQEREDRDDNTGVIYYRPALSGQAAMEIPAYAYVLGRMMHVSRTDKRTLTDIGVGANADLSRVLSVMVLKPTTRIAAKDQMGIGVPYMANPTVTKMLDLAEKHIYQEESDDGAESESETVGSAKNE